jgi:hypothetical protein
MEDSLDTLDPHRGDYACLGMLHVLKHLQDAGKEALFASLLHSHWRTVYRALPSGERDRLSVCVLAAYFEHHGDLTQVVTDAENILRMAVGNERHAAQMQGVRQRAAWLAECTARFGRGAKP